MDKVRFQAQERLDLVDANALQSLIYQYVSEALGGLMGNAGGALTTIEYTTAEAGGVYTLEIGAFQYYHAQPAVLTAVTETDGTVRQVPKHFTGQVISFNPADEGQTAAVDWTVSRALWANSASESDHVLAADNAKQAVHGGHKPGGNIHMPLLWCRPFEQDTDTDARREWSVSAQAEVAVSISTRTRIRTAFSFSTTRPTVAAGDANQNQWVAVARTVAWDFSSGTAGAAGQIIPDAPYLAPLYVWDHTASYGGYEQQNTLDTGGAQGKVGFGVARFTFDDGAKEADHGPHSAVQGGTVIECAPFEQDGATISNLARGDWAPGSKVGEPGLAGTGTAAAGANPWPYPGWYDDEAAEWKTLSSSGLNTDVPLWRLGLPHVMHMMRRQIATILSTKGKRPWYAFPEEGGIQEIHDRLDELDAKIDAEIAGLSYVEDLTSTSSALLASGRVHHGTGALVVPEAFFGEGLEIVDSLRTAWDDTAYNDLWPDPGAFHPDVGDPPRDTHGAVGIVFKCTHAGTIALGGYEISSVQITSEAFGVHLFETTGSPNYHPTKKNAGPASDKYQGITHRGNYCWVTPGDKNRNNYGTHFTVWCSSMETRFMTDGTDVVDLIADVDTPNHPGGDPRTVIDLFSATRESLGSMMTQSFETAFKLAVDFGRQWGTAGYPFTYQVTVWGKKQLIAVTATHVDIEFEFGP